MNAEDVDLSLVDWKATAENLQREVNRLQRERGDQGAVMEQAEWVATTWQRYPDYIRRRVALSTPALAGRLDALLAVVGVNDQHDAPDTITVPG